MWDGILNGCAWLLNSLAHFVGDWGLAIIIVTLVIRLILFPLQRKQFRSTHEMQKVQPKLQQLRELYSDDPQRMQEETMKLYRETGFNPLAGCLPMLVQMPIFIILFQVLRWKIGDYWTEDLAVSFYNILPNLTYTVQDAWNNPTEASGAVYTIFAILFIAMSVAPMILQMSQQGTQNKNQTIIMTVMMGAMFVWMAFVSPAGVLLYWALSSGFGFVQQLVTNRELDIKDNENEELVLKPVQVNVERKPRKKRPHKKA